MGSQPPFSPQCLGRCTRRPDVSLLVYLWIVLVLAGYPRSAAGSEAELEASILRAKPGVVLISSEVGAEVTVRCGRGPAQVVRPDAQYETGSGFIIHPDGYIATNGHVVARSYEVNERMLGEDFLETAVADVCGPAVAGLAADQRKARLRAIMADPENRMRVRLTKTLHVHLSTGKIYPAQVLAYSPAINPDAPRTASKGAGGDMGPMDSSGKEVAILKIAETNLPTVRLAANSTSLQLGEQVFILGYPGVVLNHDFLSRTSALEASVTVGRVSGFKTDITERRVIQTDAAISWGNSGGPAFNLRGEVIGAATFISTTLEGDQAIQGFNFLIPVETIHAYAREISLKPTGDSPFTQMWERAVTRYFQGNYAGAVQTVDEAERIMPGFPDLARLRSEAQMRAERQPAFNASWPMWGGGIGLALMAAAAWSLVRRRRRQTPARIPRISPDGVRSRLAAGSTVALVDARKGTPFDASAAQAVGAVRADGERAGPPALQVQVAPSGEVIVYCD